jgi:hypothetical protein
METACVCWWHETIQMPESAMQVESLSPFLAILDEMRPIYE